MARDPASTRRTKIVCTLGPATDREGVLERLFERGMDAARLNMSFGEPDEHVRRIAALRAVAQRTRHRPIAVILDLPGRKLRVGRLAHRSLHVDPGSAVELVADTGQVGTELSIPADRGIFHENMIRGDKILLADGLVELVVREVGQLRVKAEVVYGGVISERTGVHVPGLPLRGGPLGPGDDRLLELAIREEVDYVALSHVGDAADLLSVREKLIDLGRDIPLIAKIERSEAFARLDGILGRSDAVMIRRGDLGAEIEVTRIPLVQKDIIRLANQRGVPVIIATQMLGSMIEAPTPTRAEASDVSNAVADGADGVLLSAETATGRFPVEAVDMMSRIVRETERSRANLAPAAQASTAQSFADATASIACQAAIQLRARFIVCFTESGRTATLVGKYRPAAPIIAFCTQDSTRRKLALAWGIRTDELGAARDVETMVREVERRLLDGGLVRPGDRLVIAYGAPVAERGHTNSVRLHEVGQDPGGAASLRPSPSASA